MATNTNVKFFHVTSLPDTYEQGGIYFLDTTPSGGSVAGDIYVATTTTTVVKYTSDVQSVTFSDATPGSPYTGGTLTVTDKHGVETSYSVASQQDLTDLATALMNEIADLNVTGYEQATVGTGSSSNSAVITVSGIKEEDGIISAATNKDTEITIAGGNNITVGVSGNTITIAGENGGVQSITAGTGIAVDNTDAANPTVGIDSTFVDGELSATNQLATQSTVTTAVNTAIDALDGNATIASKSEDGVVTIKTGVTETDGVISNDSGADITLAKVAVTGAYSDLSGAPVLAEVATSGAAEDVSIADVGGKYAATTVEGALAELVDVAHSGAAADVSIADSKFTATNVEDALAELKGDIAAINQFEYVVASALPTASVDTMYKIYLIPQDPATQTPDVYNEYITVASGSSPVTYSWELFGTTQVDISNKADKVSGATSGNFAGLDANGNLTDSGKKASDFQPAGNYKTTQTAVYDPTASGDSITFIDSISQDTNGVITPTKKTVQSASATQAGLMSSTDFSKLAGIAAGAQANVLEAVKINGTALSIDSTDKSVNILTETAYDASTNKIATMRDVESAALCWESF